MMQGPQSCDTFVVLQPHTHDEHVIFGKNSDRPQNEVQEVVLIKGGRRPPKQQCTYILVEQTPIPINSVILSKPAWMWGAEMGANDKNVVIGNEAVWTKYNVGDGDSSIKRLLGMDLVRLGLERGNTAEHAVSVITSLLEEYGQGGPCAENDCSLVYHNSFLIADTKEAWVLETSGKFWVAEKIESGYRNISNILTIKNKFDKHSKDLQLKAKEIGLWDGENDFNFSEVFGAGGDQVRQVEGERLLERHTHYSHFDLKKMMRILREKEHRICRDCDDAFPTMGSQVSRLCPLGVTVHLFTATPDTSLSCFKPFVFTRDAEISDHTCSPENEPLREHYLYKLHAEHVIHTRNKAKAMDILHMESECIADLEEKIEKIEMGTSPIESLDGLMKGCVDDEIERYNSNNVEEVPLFSI